MKSLRKVYGFMDTVKNDTYFANKIRDDLIFIVNYTKNIDEEELSKNEILLDSMMFRLIQISENAKRLSDEYNESLWDAIYFGKWIYGIGIIADFYTGTWLEYDEVRIVYFFC